MIAFLFPGQGAQYIGMGRSLYEGFPAARAVFDRANSLLGFDLAKVCFDGPADELTKSDISQPAILTCSMAGLAAMGNPPAAAAAGLSLGEYTALVAAGAIEFDQAVPLVHDRGRYMQEACGRRPGTMASIIALDRPKVDQAIREASPAGTVAVANVNCPGQIVISGEAGAVDKACELAKQLGAKMAIKLNVAGAFHSPLMEPARLKLVERLKSVDIREPRLIVVSNVTGLPIRTPAEIRDHLARQVTSSVLWEDSMRHLLGMGIREFAEIGPGKVLAGLMKRIEPAAAVNNVDGAETV